MYSLSSNYTTLSLCNTHFTILHFRVSLGTPTPTYKIRLKILKGLLLYMHVKELSFFSFHVTCIWYSSITVKIFYSFPQNCSFGHGKRDRELWSEAFGNYIFLTLQDSQDRRFTWVLPASNVSLTQLKDYLYKCYSYYLHSKCWVYICICKTFWWSNLAHSVLVFWCEPNFRCHLHGPSVMIDQLYPSFLPSRIHLFDIIIHIKQPCRHPVSSIFTSK